jgi:hypothetical protein
VAHPIMCAMFTGSFSSDKVGQNMELLRGKLLGLLYALITWRLTQCSFHFIIKNYCFVHLYSLSVEGTDALCAL